jgi:hypothetical protein
MSKEIDQLDLSTAQEIAKWLPVSTDKTIYSFPNVDLKARVRTYLRGNKLTPNEALEKIRKQNSSMPKRMF